MAKLSGWLGGAEAEQSRGLSTRLAVADEQFPDPLEPGQVTGTHGFSPLRLANREQLALTGSVIAGYDYIDLVGDLAFGVVDYPLADLRHYTTRNLLR
jgi:hypothetical protein